MEPAGRPTTGAHSRLTAPFGMIRSPLRCFGKEALMVSRSLALLLFVAAAWAASLWTQYGYGGGDKTETAHCGEITGTLGTYNPWAGAAGTNYIFTHANEGAKWNGNQFDAASALPLTVTDTHFHYWAKEGGGLPDQNTLRVQTWEMPDVGGTAAQYRPGTPWAWTTSTKVEFPSPSVHRQNAGTNQWILVEWTVGGGTQNTFTWTGQAKPDLTTTPVASGNSGGFAGSLALPLLPSESQLRISFPWKVIAGASCDNAKVTNWREGVHYDIVSLVVDADPMANFDYTGEPFVGY